MKAQAHAAHILRNGGTVTRFRVGLTAVLTCLAALALVPSAFAHHARISGSMDCQGTVTFTASSWQSSSTLGRTHNDVRVYLVQANGSTVSPAQQVGSGQFKSSNGFAFSGNFAAPALVNSVKLNVKEIGSWANGTGSSNGGHAESSVVISRSTSGCTPPPTDECPNIAGNQASIPAGMVKDASGNCVTPPPPPTDECPNIAGNQTSIPVGMIKDTSGNCVTPPPPPTDECPNIAGNQTSIPVGMIKDTSGNCVTPPPPSTDECPNIEGIQTSVPAGMTKDASGTCSTPPPPPPPPTDECPNIEGIQTSTPAGMVKDGSGACVTPLPPAAVVASATAPVAKATPKAKVVVKKKAKKKAVKKKQVVKKKAVKKQSTAAKAKPRALPFTP